MAVENAREIFETYFPERLTNSPELVGKINTSFKFVVTGDAGSTWLVDLTKDGGEIKEEDGDATCTVTVSDGSLVDMVNGKLNHTMAFMTGKLKVSDVASAMKLAPLLG